MLMHFLLNIEKGVSHHTQCGCSFPLPLGCGLNEGDVAPAVPDTAVGPPRHRLPIHHILTFKLVFGKSFLKAALITNWLHFEALIL